MKSDIERTRASWKGMVARCTNPRASHYADYGGRGIRVCERWLRSFADFCVDMGRAPLGFSIERIDNDRDYEPGNCRWATKREQVNNTRRTTFVTLRGRTLSLADMARFYGLTEHIVRGRIGAGWSTEEAFTTPVMSRASRRKGPSLRATARQPQQELLVISMSKAGAK